MRNDGFTLIELLVVLGIVGILASIGLPRYNDTRERAFMATMQSDLYRLILAQELHWSGGDRPYASDLGELTGGFEPTEGVTLTILGATEDYWAAEAEHAVTDQVCNYSTDTAVIACGTASQDDKGDGK